MTFIHDFDAVDSDRSGDCPVDNHPVSCLKAQSVGQGVFSHTESGAIWSRMTGLVRDYAPARGRQARPDLIEIKSGIKKEACLTASFSLGISVQNYFPARRHAA